MSELFPVTYIARHGDTAWTVSGQHTGLIDLPLNENGQCNARRLGERLKGMTFVKVFTSPLQRARRTCELAGFAAGAEVDPDLVEWNYGKYEGLRTTEIHKDRPDWELFKDGCPGGETRTTSRRAGRSRDRAPPRNRGERPCLFERPFSSRLCGSLACARFGLWGEVFSAETGEPERGRL